MGVVPMDLPVATEIRRQLCAPTVPLNFRGSQENPGEEQKTQQKPNNIKTTRNQVYVRSVENEIEASSVDCTATISPKTSNV
jgi:hypothetical protein